MENFMLEYLNKTSGTNIKEMEVFHFTTSPIKRRFNGNKLEFNRNTVTFGNEWVEDPTKYNALLNCRITT